MGIGRGRTIYRPPGAGDSETLETDAFLVGTVELDLEYKFNRLQPKPLDPTREDPEHASNGSDWCFRLSAGMTSNAYGPELAPQGAAMYINFVLAYYWGWGIRRSD